MTSAGPSRGTLRRAAIIGAGQHTWRPDMAGTGGGSGGGGSGGGGSGGGGAPEPLTMWEEVARLAAADAGADGAPARLDRIDVVYCHSWQYDDPPGRLAERLGAHPASARYSGIGGTVPQVLVSEAAEAIARGELDLALVVGGEALATRRRLRKAGERPAWGHPPAERRPFPLDPLPHPAELAHGVFEAWLTFALFEVARRGAAGAEPEAYRRELGELLCPMTAVAARHPGAWFPMTRTVDEIVTPSAGNRMVALPYTKLMTAIMDVDMAAAVLVASDEAADSLGVTPDRRVYLRGWAYAEDPHVVAARPDLARSPAMERAARAALAGAGAGIDDVAHLDLYACFPSSVGFALDALQIDPASARSRDPARAPERPVTLTGGLASHGGPGSNFMTHALATMVGALREDPGALGLVSGVGMHMARHVFGVWSTDPGPARPGTPLARGAPAPEAAGPASVPVVESFDGRGRIAAYTIVYDQDGEAQSAVLVCDVPGGRCYARLDGDEALAPAAAEELVGEAVHLTPAGGGVNAARLV